MNVIFMGTPDFACPSLKMLIEDERFNVLEVYTQPDRRKGRGKKLQAPPVKGLAKEYGIKVNQPETLKSKEVVESLKKAKPDFFVVVAYGQILTKEHLEIPILGAINVHASLLPKYRGAAPIHWAVIKGEAVTGVTTMKMDEGLDTGDMLLKKEVNISKDLTTGELHDHLAEIGAKLLLQTLVDVRDHGSIGISQNEEEACYAPKITKETAKIDWSQDAGSIHNLIRGLNPVPKAETNYLGKKMKILHSEVIEEGSQGIPGEIISADSKGCVVATGRGQLRITKIQMSGKKAMDVKDYLVGNTFEIGTRFGGNHA